MHAGVQATMADHTAGGAAATMIEPDHIVLTVEFKINLLRAAKGERLTCHSQVLKPGSRLIVVESEVLCGKGRCIDSSVQDNRIDGCRRNPLSWTVAINAGNSGLGDE